ncbi:SdrD B-like domain-containing protein [Leucobacter ruminantium]|uniref:SD-repeat containing protein B domain-containing protein n=1 Tax=Leucobacter ruminantium TaxID=1289170 RepID=A0A939LUU2_9MICO|nr:hypothetical protein [Leucobacter ruminantium]
MESPIRRRNGFTGAKRCAAVVVAMALAVGLGPTAAWAAPEPPGDGGAQETPAEVPGDAAESGAGETPTETAAEPAEGLAPTPLEAPVPAPFAGDEASLSLTITQSTGTEPFQLDNGPGHDSGPDNNIVRTNDTVTYNLGIRYEGDDQTAPTVKFELPRGQELLQLPPFCLAGSSVDPATLPAPTAPLTATSWEALPRQTVTCVLKDENMGTALNYAFIAQVRSEVPNGTVMDEVTFSVTSEQVAEPATIAPEQVTVSAAADYDLSKRIDSTDPNKGWTWQNNTACPAPNSGEACQNVIYPLTVTLPAGGKGATPLIGDISFIENLDPESFYGADVWAQMVAAAGSVADAKAKYGPQYRSWTRITSGNGSRSSLPYGGLSLGDYTTPENSVRESGTINASGTGRGEPTTITISGMDTTGITVPSTTGNGNALPANLGFVASFELSIAVPQAAVIEFGGEESGGSFAIETHNEFTDFTATALDGTPVTESEENLANNERDLTIRVERGAGVNKGFAGIPGVDGNTPPQQFMPADAVALPGPPGSGVWKDGNTVVMPGQAVYSVLMSQYSGPDMTGATNTVVACDVWDADRLSLAAHPDWNGKSEASYPGNNRPVFPVLVRSNNLDRPASQIGEPQSGVQSLKVEYSSGPAGPGAQSDCSSGTWSENPGDIANPTVDAQGRTVWDGVNRVRVTWVASHPANTLIGTVYLRMAIGQVVKDSDSTAPIGNWASQANTAGTKTAEQVFADPAKRTLMPSYNPATHQGTQGDRLWQGDARVRVHKLVENPGTGEFVDAAVPQYTSGNSIRYRLDPSLTGDVTVDGTKQRVTIEDCLPRYQVFESAMQGAGALAPQTVQMGAPAGAEITCDASRQYLKWDLGELAVGAPIEPIVVTAEILDVARNGVFTNDVVIASPADSSPVSVRSDHRQMQLVVPTGLKISKTVDPGVIEVNPDGVTNPRTLKWSVYFANIDGPPNVANVDVIDVLPADGLNSNVYTGSLRFESAAPVAGDNITVLYTKTAAAALNSDPSDASNAADGSTVWCDAPSGGAVVSGAGDAAVDCPQSNEEVTGLRFQRPGQFNPDDEFQVDILMTPVGNHSGDVYRNITSGRADGVSQGVGPARRDATVIASQIGDFVWNDLNGNGVQDAGEPGIAGVPVRLTGTDVDGNAVSLQTTTDANGKYLFAELASGDYRVTFDISGLAGYVFTQKGAGSDPALDSNADPATGEAEVTLGKDTQDLTIDAGVVQRFGGLIINKQLEGVGVKDIAAQDELVFNVVCTLGGATVFEQDVTLAVNGRTAVTSGELAPIPAGAECVVTETGAGHSDPDSLPDPVTVTIPWNPTTGESGTVTASLTNYYSAGRLQLKKVLEGDATRLAQVKDTQFEFLITCQVEEQNDSGETVRADVVSGTWKLRGGETIILGSDDRTPLTIPAGAHCFGQETDNGGATSATISSDSFENAVVVEGGKPDELQTLAITAVNTFTCANGACGPGTPGKPGTPGGLSLTGGSFAAAAVAGIALLAAGMLLLARRRRGADAAAE